MVDHGLARLTRDNRVERPGDGPGEPGGTSLIGKRADGIVALANVASLDPAPIPPLVDLTPFLGGKRPALVAGPPRSEERRAGKWRFSTCRRRWSPDNYTKKTKYSRQNKS